MMNTPPRFTLVPAYHSPVVESHDLGIVEKAKRTRGKARVWTTIINITFTDTIVAHNFYNEAWFQLPRGISFPATNDFHESVWLPILVEAHDALPKVDPTGESALLYRSLINSKKSYTNKSLSGDTICYVSKSKACPHQFLVQLNSETKTAEIRYVNERIPEYMCVCGQTIYNASRGMLPVVKNCLATAIESGHSEPRHLQRQCEINDVPVPKRSQISNWKSRISTAAHGKKGETLLEHVKAYVDAHSALPPPERPDEAFYAASHFDMDKNEFIVLISTLRLLQIIMNRPGHPHMLHSDAMHQCSVDNCKVMREGVSDKNRTYHDIGVAISTNEREQDWVICYRGLLEYAPAFYPIYNMSDDSGAIRNAATSVWPNIDALMCYQHVHNVSNNLYRCKYTICIGVYIPCMVVCLYYIYRCIYSMYGGVCILHI